MASNRYKQLKLYIWCTYKRLFVPYSEIEAGGYNYRFVKGVLPKYICGICNKVLRDPRLTKCCGYHYCESCLKKWERMKAKNTCPRCQQENFEHVVNKEKIREIGGLIVQCTYHSQGCSWYGNLKDIEHHLLVCGKEMIYCNNTRCHMQVERRHLTKHQQHECMHRQYTCEFCGYEDTYDAIAGSGRYRKSTYSWIFHNKNHYDLCDQYPLDCPNSCGEKNIKRKDMDTHHDSCKLEPLDCPFKNVGCIDKIQRMNMDSHCQESMQKHLLLLNKSHQELVRENRRLANELAEKKLTSPVYFLKNKFSKN